MAGSLNHIIDEDGAFTMDCIDNIGDAHEALEECFYIILSLSGGDMKKISKACKLLKYPDPYDLKQDALKSPMKKGY